MITRRSQLRVGGLWAMRSVRGCLFTPARGSSAGQCELGRQPLRIGTGEIDPEREQGHSGGECGGDHPHRLSAEGAEMIIAHFMVDERLHGAFRRSHVLDESREG